MDTAAETLLDLYQGGLVQSLSLAANAVEAGGQDDVPQGGVQGFGWINNTSAVLVVALSEGGSLGATAPLTVPIPAYSGGTIPGRFSSVSVVTARTTNGGAGTVDFYWTQWKPPFMLTNFSPPAGGAEGNNNTFTVPKGVNLTLDVSGAFVNNTITVTKTGTGLPTIITGRNIVDSDLTITEGDHVMVGDMGHSSVVSGNTAGNISASTEDTYDGTGTPVVWTLTAGMAGQATLYADINSPPNGGALTYTWYLDGLQVFQIQVPYGGPGQSGTSAPFTVPVGDHQLTMEYTAAEFNDKEIQGNLVLTWEPTGNSYDLPLAPGTVGNAGAPSVIDVAEMLNSGIVADGDTISVGSMLGSQISNQTEGQAGAVTGSAVRVRNMANSTIYYSSPVTAIIDGMTGAKVTVAAGIAAPGATVTSNGDLTTDTTVTSTTPVVLSAPRGTVGLTGQGLPRYTFDALLVDNVVTTVAAGAQYNSPMVDCHGLSWVVSAVSGVSGTALDYAIGVYSYAPLMQSNSPAPSFNRQNNSGLSSSSGVSNAGAGLNRDAQMPSAATQAAVINANTTDSLTFTYLEIVGG